MDSCPIGRFKCSYTGGGHDDLPEQTLSHCLADGMETPDLDTIDSMRDRLADIYSDINPNIISEDILLKNIVCKQMTENEEESTTRFAPVVNGTGQVGGATGRRDDDAQKGIESNMRQVPQARHDGMSATLKTMLRKNMTGSCGPTYEVNDANQVMQFNCEYRGPYRDDDGTMRNTKMIRSGRIHSCDSNQDHSRQTMNDILEIAHFKFGGQEREIDKTKIFCDIHSLPNS